jgi:hypothetical protein
MTTTLDGCIINSKTSNLYHAYDFDGNNGANLYTLNLSNCELNAYGLIITNKLPFNNTLGATFNYNSTTTELLNLTNSKANITTLSLYGRDDQKGVPTMVSLVKLINSQLTTSTNTTYIDTLTQSIHIFDASAASKLYLTGSFSAAVNTPTAIFWIRNGSEFYTPTAATYTNLHADAYILREGAESTPYRTSIISSFNSVNWWFNPDYQMIKVVKY